jgi:diguanylate cyclase (GGDEF)-like protein
MSADLKHINLPASSELSSRRFSSKLSQAIAALYAFTFVSVVIGTGFALYQNWTVRQEQAQSHLVRSAHMGNFLMETALTSAAKSLDSTQVLFSDVLQMGPMDRALAGQLLKASDAKFKAYNPSDVFGQMFFVDPQGRWYAPSDGAADTGLDVSDRHYFHQLRDHPGLSRTVGPLVLDRTTGQWVFHMSVPVIGKNGELAGVLVQEILEKAMAHKLAQYLDLQHLDALITHFDGIAPSFVYPAPDLAASPSPLFLPAPTLPHGCDGEAQTSPQMLMGFAKSGIDHLGTCATWPKSKLRAEFWNGNVYLMLYAWVGIVFSSAMFHYLYGLSQKLTEAQMQSLQDPLTGLHNRRALDEKLPLLLRMSQRAQKPISVLFIDIDHFRFFNENYGHESGDVALQAVARTLQAMARRPLDLACRWGGEEFVLVLPETPCEAAVKVADDVLNAVRRIDLQSTHGDRPRLTVSIGHVTRTVQAHGPQDELVDLADKAMLEAKTQGRDRRVASEWSQC